MDKQIGFVENLQRRGDIVFADLRITNTEEFEKVRRVCIGTLAIERPVRMIDFFMSSTQKNVFGFTPSKAKCAVPFLRMGKLSGKYKVTSDMLDEVVKKFYEQKAEGYQPPVVVE